LCIVTLQRYSITLFERQPVVGAPLGLPWMQIGIGCYLLPYVVDVICTHSLSLDDQCFEWLIPKDELVGGASALVTFFCVRCTLRTRLSRLICNFPLQIWFLSYCRPQSLENMRQTRLSSRSIFQIFYIFTLVVMSRLRYRLVAAIVIISLVIAELAFIVDAAVTGHFIYDKYHLFFVHYIINTTIIGIFFVALSRKMEANFRQVGMQE
jgi:hypothetical protein